MGLVKFVGISYQNVHYCGIQDSIVEVTILDKLFVFKVEDVNVYAKENFIQIPVNLAVEKGLIN